MFRKLLLLITSLLIILPNNGCISQKRKAKSLESVFQVFTANENDFSTGTTFAIAKAKSGKTLFLTNNHICAGIGSNGSIIIIEGLGSESIPFEAKVVKTDSSKDLCLLESDLVAPPMTIKNSCKTGEEVTVIGNPNGVFPIILDMYISQEKIDKMMIPFTELDPDGKITMLSGKVVSGHSGSPVISSDGSVCGIVFAAAIEYGGFAMSGVEIERFISSYSGL